MGRAPCCSKEGLQRGPWTAMEDTLLIDYVRAHGEGNWRSLPKKACLLRCGKSCRLRWMNYLRPDIKRGNITPDEDDLIIRLHSLLGNRWSLIARRLPGRTDNEIKNYWNSHLKKGVKQMGKTLEKPSKINNKNGEIYRPKPYRVTSSITSGPTSGTSNAREDKGSKPSVEAPGLPWLQADNEGGSEGDAGGVLVHNQHDDESELYSQYDQMPTNDNKFEKLYQEYLELLMADDRLTVLLPLWNHDLLNLYFSFPWNI